MHRMRSPMERERNRRTLGDLHPGCDCKAAWQPGLVLDPFIGSGTVAVVADRHGRDWLGIELNPAFGGIAAKGSPKPARRTTPDDVQRRSAHAYRSDHMIAPTTSSRSHHVESTTNRYVRVSTLVHLLPIGGSGL